MFEKNIRCEAYLIYLLDLWYRRNYNIFCLKSQWRVSSWLLWRLRVSLRVCFVLKLFSHTSSSVLLLTQMRSGISRGDEMMSTVFLLNSVSSFLLYLQNATSVLIVHRGVLLCRIWHRAAFQRNTSVVLGDGCHWCTHVIKALSISWGKYIATAI